MYIQHVSCYSIHSICLSGVYISLSLHVSLSLYVDISRRLAENVLKALEELKPTSVVGVELQDVDLGSVAPQILGVKVIMKVLLDRITVLA